MKILVIDGQGGRIGCLFIETIKKKASNIHITAVGSNSIATASMLKAGADEGATGENPVIFNSKNTDFIMGPIGIIIANSLLGEITPRMAEAISSSHAKKILIPIKITTVTKKAKSIIIIPDKYLALTISFRLTGKLIA